eukprot:COSAG02_NODE_2875_length_7843_cov_877.610795_2_plen_171_part_00
MHRGTRVRTGGTPRARSPLAVRASLGVTNGSAGTPAKTTRPEPAEKETWHVDDMLGHTLSDGHKLRKLGPKELVKVRRAFNDIDADGSGHIDIIEVRALPSRAVSCTANLRRATSAQIRGIVEKIGQQETGDPLTKEEVDDILVQLDENGDGTISFEGTFASYVLSASQT